MSSLDPPPLGRTVADVFGSPPAADHLDPLLTELATLALACADQAAAVLQRGLAGRPQSVGTKSSATDMVSDVDRSAEAIVSRLLAAYRPHDGVLGEEGTARAGSSGIRWVVDPLDGTTNFLFGIPQFAVSLAAEVDGAAQVGIVVDHRGARPGPRSRDGAPAATANRAGWPLAAPTWRPRWSRPVSATNRPGGEWQGAVAAHILPRVRDIRRFGAASLDLCWTAGGRYDAYYEWGLNPWDLAAGALICNEAGGRVEALAGRLIVATTPELFDPFCQLLTEAGAMDIPPGSEPKLW